MESETSRVLISLLIVFAAGKLMGEVFERMRQPAVIGELLAGIIIGPGLLGWVEPGAVLSTVATMGVIVLMFVVGLETRPSELFKVGGRAFVVGSCRNRAAARVRLLVRDDASGAGTPEAIFIGTALVATSVGITARVLADRGFLSATEARIILAAAVIDDVLGMLVLSLVVGSSRGGVDMAHIAILVAQVVAFVGFEMWLAPKLVARHAHWLDQLKIPNAGFVVALIVMLGDGRALRGDRPRRHRRRLLRRHDVRRDGGPLGAHAAGEAALRVARAVLLRGDRHAGPAVAVRRLEGARARARARGHRDRRRRSSVAAWARAGMGWRRMVAIGVGMVPRGEVGLIVASTGLAMGVIGSATYAMIILVVVVTTVIVPPLLAVVFPWAMAEPIDPVAERLAEAPLLLIAPLADEDGVA